MYKKLLLKHISRKEFKTINWNGKKYLPYLDVIQINTN